MHQQFYIFVILFLFSSYVFFSAFLSWNFIPSFELTLICGCCQASSDLYKVCSLYLAREYIYRLTDIFRIRYHSNEWLERQHFNESYTFAALTSTKKKERKRTNIERRSKKKKRRREMNGISQRAYMNKQYVEYVRAYAFPRACSISLKFNQRKRYCEIIKALIST